MLNTEKKVVFLSGSVQLPLKIGLGASIFHNDRLIRTSIVAAIMQVAEGFIVFETQNSTYCVASHMSPEPAAMVIRVACA